MLFKDPSHEPAIDSLLMDLMHRWVVHDVPHRDVVLCLQDLNYLMAVLGHLDVDRLVLSFERHAAEKEKGRPEQGLPMRIVLKRP